jgi:hypothetical protein
MRWPCVTPHLRFVRAKPCPEVKATLGRSQQEAGERGPMALPGDSVPAYHGCLGEEGTMGMAVCRPPPRLAIEDRLWTSQSVDATPECRT